MRGMDPRIREWLRRDPDPETRRELTTLVEQNDKAELERRFKARLEFGTAGLRGFLGAGPNRMNRLVIRETTAGLGEYVKATVKDAMQRGVVVAHDARKLSKEFAADTAAVLSAQGFRVYLFGEAAPTPLAAFAVRTLKAAAGVVVTASHNPPEYNGYKVYWEDGAQIIAPHDRGIASAIERAANLHIPFLRLEDAEASGRVIRLGEEMRSRYLVGVRALSTRPATSFRETFPIAYTPLHGVGAAAAEAALEAAGFTNVRTVAEQREPDGTFPTVRFPNPEEPGAMDRVVALAREMQAPVAFANDPDADRLAVAALRPDDEYRRLTGDQIGALLGAERLANAPVNGIVISTIVSSRLLGVMARAAGIEYAETLTGHKWIANAGFAAEARGREMLFGYEEALGYTIGGLVRDKDGISALVCFAELAAAYAEIGKSVIDRLAELYRRHGFYLTGQKSLALDPDRKGPSTGELLRGSPPNIVGGLAVERVTDIQTGLRRHRGGRTEKVDWPHSDVLIYELTGGSRVIIRPSGTEPKLKCYYEVVELMGGSESYLAVEKRAEAKLNALAVAHQQEISELSR
jgi:phosphomannomutase